MLTWELLGALVGAGFASGREIASFFAKYGPWGYIGAFLAAGTLVWLAGTKFPSAWAGHWQAHLWHALVMALLTATAGAMLSGAGEITALVLPFRGAYGWGIAGTLLISWVLASKTDAGLAWVSRGMVAVFAGVLTISMTAEGSTTALIRTENAVQALTKGLCYGGFNAALLIPVLRKSNASSEEKDKALRLSGIITLLLLVIGIAALQRHPQLLYEPLPFIRLLQRFGILGYDLSAVCLYLAILSTLTACIRGIGGSAASLVLILFVSCFGFGKVVDVAYSFLGGACMTYLLAAKFRNYAQKAFISGGDML